MYGDPPTRVVKDATFLPYNRTGPWGVFDKNHEIVMESLDLRGAAREPHFKHLRWPETVGDICEAPDEEYIYGGLLNPHYGHFLINSLPRFWPFFYDKKQPKVLCASPIEGVPGFIKDILSRLGLGSADIVSFDRPTKIKSLLVPSPCVLEQYWAYTIYRDLCHKISRDVWTSGEVDSNETPAYLSKAHLRSGVGAFEDEHIIEVIVKAAGIDILYPETLSFTDQIRLFATRHLVIGPTGSAFHTSIFAPPGRRLLCYNPIREINSNFSLIDKLNSNKAFYFYQEGMTYSASPNFMTVVRPADAQRLGEDLVSLTKERKRIFNI